MILFARLLNLLTDSVFYCHAMPLMPITREDLELVAWEVREISKEMGLKEDYGFRFGER
jgi:hypothetical protein